MAEKRNIKSLLFFLLKVGLAVLIVWLLIRRDPREMLECLRHFDYRWLIPAMIFYGSHMVTCSWRWQRLARMLDVELPFIEALSLTMQGYFFSLVIPGGALGGDVVKMGVISKRSASGSKMEGAFTVLMDRIVGMISLFTLTLVLLGPAVPLLMKIHWGRLPVDARLNILLVAGVALLCLAGLGASCVIFFHRSVQRIPGVKFLMDKAERFGHGAVSRLTAAADVYAGHWKELIFLTLVTTFFVHLMTVTPLFFLFEGLRLHYSFFDVIVAVLIGNIAGLIPISPGGVGIRDLVTITILVAGGVAAGDAKIVQLLATAIMIVFSLAGGLFFIFDPGRRKKEEAKNDGEQ